jgi:hypothetical protein
MDPRHLFIDERLTGMCVYCGAQPNTRDHVPSKVLLDEPYPAQLPVVGACESCNASFSLDEQYLACFIECVICGTVDTAGLRRPNVTRILTGNPALQRRIEASRRRDQADNLLWQPEINRVRKIVLKLARGHVAYELYPKLDEPLEVTFVPLPTLSEEEQSAFENLTSGRLDLWPEIGSWAFRRASGKGPDRFEQSGDWVVVQPGRYRYAAVETGGLLVKVVLSEYLACAVSWE